MPTTRAQRRSGGKRAKKRACHEAVSRVLELAGKGFKPSVIASVVGIDESFVRLVLEEAGEVRAGEVAAK